MAQRFNLMLTGNTLPGRSRAAVAVELAKVMRIPGARALELLSGKEQIVKRDLDVATLGRYHHALRGAGAETRAKEMTVEEELAAQGGTVPMRPPDSDGSLGGKNVVDMTDKELDALIRALEAPIEIPGGKVECPCCRMIALKQRSIGGECAVCGWRDFPGQNEYHLDKSVAGRNFGLSLAEARQEFEAHGSIDPQNYTPNEVPLRKRVINSLIGLFLVAYCSYSLWIDQLYFPFINRYAPGQSKIILFRGIDAWVMAAALLFAVLFCVLSVVDHYDRRRNERHYQKAVQACVLLFMVFMWLALTMHLYRAEGLGSALWMAVGLLVAIAALVVRFRSGPIGY